MKNSHSFIGSPSSLYLFTVILLFHFRDSFISWQLFHHRIAVIFSLLNSHFFMEL